MRPDRPLSLSLCPLLCRERSQSKRRLQSWCPCRSRHHRRQLGVGDVLGGAAELAATVYTGGASALAKGAMGAASGGGGGGGGAPAFNPFGGSPSSQMNTQFNLPTFGSSYGGGSRFSFGGR